MSLFGLNSASFVQGFDTRKANFSKLKELPSKFFSTSGNYFQSNYGAQLDSTIIDMCEEYLHACSAAYKNPDFRSKLRHTNYGVPSVHYEVKKPAMNIIGGFVGAKSQQNRENYNYCIQEFVVKLLPDILPETSQMPEHITAEFLDVHRPAKDYLNKKVDVNRGESKEEIYNFQNTVKMSACALGKIQNSQERKDVTPFSNTLTAENVKSHKGNGGSESPSYASIVPSSGHSLSKEKQTPAPQSEKNISMTRKNAKNRRKRKRRLKKQMELEKKCQQTSIVTVNDSFLNDDNHFAMPFENPCALTSVCVTTIEENSAFVSSGQDDVILSRCISAEPDYLVCGIDEIDSPCMPNESATLDDAKDSSFACNNNTIAFIMNGNDELSDTDSDWSCDALDNNTLQDDGWEVAFKENFQCFQNFFSLETFPSSITNSDKDNDFEVQDDEVCFYINPIDLESELLEEEIVAARLRDVNQRWNSSMEDVVVTEKHSKVYFAPDSHLVEVYYLDRIQDDTRTDHYHLDRCRFKQRIQALESLIAPCLDWVHRQKVWERLQSCVCQDKN